MKRWTSSPTIGESTHDDEVQVEGEEVAEEAEEYTEEDWDDLAGLGSELEGSDLILDMIPLPLS